MTIENNKNISYNDELTFLEEEFTKININNNNNTSNETIIDEWTHIFNFLSYDGVNEKIITSNDIKNAGKTWKGSKSQFEPRLLCKQDTLEKRPDIFKKNNLYILSVKNGEYLLTKTYSDLSKMSYEPIHRELLCINNEVEDKLHSFFYRVMTDPFRFERLSLSDILFLVYK